MKENPSPRVRIEAEGTDLDEAVSLFESAYCGTRWRASLTDRTFSYRQSAIGDSNMTLRSNRFNGRVSGAASSGDEYVVFWYAGGSGVFDTDRNPRQIPVGQPTLIPTDRPAAFDMADVDQKLVHFDKAFLERIAQEQFGARPGPLTLASNRRPDGPAVQAWRSTIALVSRMTLDPSISPVLQAEMSRLAGLSLLALYPVVEDDTRRASGWSGSARVKAAVDYIESHCQSPITTTMIATESGLSLRALQEAFRRELDTTPNAYLRAVRLDRVHQALLIAEPGQVGSIAKEWGFANLGRFAAEYAKKYGEVPSRTGRE